MALVAQANVRQLQVAAHKRLGAAPAVVPAPGAVLRFREALIDWQVLKNYPEGGLLLRMHEVWGQYCLFCWLFDVRDPNHPPDFARAAAEEEIRCSGHLGAKLIDIQRGLWRLRHEDRLRHDPEFRQRPDFPDQIKAADDIPMLVFGQNVRMCSHDDLLACTCQYVGMLAAIRWTADSRWRWDDPGIRELDANPGG